MINRFKFCIHFAFKFNMRRYNEARRQAAESYAIAAAVRNKAERATAAAAASAARAERSEAEAARVALCIDDLKAQLQAAAAESARQRQGLKLVHFLAQPEPSGH
jgi:hypothetical protein